MIGKALLACKEQLVQREEGDRLIVLVSDGYSFDLRGDKVQEIIKILKDHNIPVIAIHIGGSAVPDPIANITGLTGGAVFNPDDPDTLQSVFQRIDEMQETRMEKAAAEMMDHFLPYCVIGLPLLGVCVGGRFGLRYTPW